VIVADAFVVGRGPDVDLPIDDESVSRRHAQFRLDDDQPVVEDLQSRNGTFVNRRPIVGRARLSIGDRIALGSCELELLRAAAPAPFALEPVTKPILRDMIDVTIGAGALAALSPREREMFGLLAEGLPQREIAKHFKVSVKTVETYRTRIGQKLGLRNRAELIRFALDAGVLRPSRLSIVRPA
jgi:DNA-binding CsgD family transcriptional regulator